ncbi:MAG: hypothetical protein A2190_02830 [Lysobacterales bacterium RIFOXYA1_FULL_69_10]|nr:MAG: hypothetical protein A2190_02830 [Xanthomonadales bacterium RIFOXYA1_FULL_69_10]
MQAVEAQLQQWDAVLAQLAALVDDRLKQRLHDVAELAHGHDAGHARATLQGVQVALQADQRLALGRVLAQLGQQAVGVVEQVAAFLDEDVDQFRVEFAQVERFVRVGLDRDRYRHERRHRCRLGLGLDGLCGLRCVFGRVLDELRQHLVGGGLFSRDFVNLGLARFGLLSCNPVGLRVLGFQALVLEPFFFCKTLGLGLFRSHTLGFGLLGGKSLGFDSLSFGPFGFGALAFKAFGLRVLGGLLLCFKASRFGAFRLGPLQFHALGFKPLGFGLLVREALRSQTLGFETLDLGLLGGDAFGLGPLGGLPLLLEPLLFATLAFDALVLQALGVRFFGLDTLDLEPLGCQTLCFEHLLFQPQGRRQVFGIGIGIVRERHGARRFGRGGFDCSGIAVGQERAQVERAQGLVMRGIVRLDHVPSIDLGLHVHAVAGRTRCRQGVAKRGHAFGQAVEHGHTRALGLQRGQRVADRGADRVQPGHALGSGRRAGGQQALDVRLGWRGDLGDDRHFGHREGAVERVDRTLQAVVGRVRRSLGGGQPVLDGGQVAGDLGIEDLEQHRIHRGGNARHVVDVRLAAGIDGSFRRFHLLGGLAGDGVLGLRFERLR